MAIYDPTALRLQLLANGYLPTPNLDKRCMLKGWTSQGFVDALAPDIIQGWVAEHRAFKATGVLVRNGLMPIDFDISDKDMMGRMLDALEDIAPEVYEAAPWRTGKAPKLMVFARWVPSSDPSSEWQNMFVREATDKFVDGNGVSHMIEVFGGAKTKAGRTSKQVGAFGPHSYEEVDGKINFRKVLREYTWEDGRSIYDVKLADLPVMTPEQMWALLKAFTDTAIELGWTRVVSAAKSQGAFVYDITELTKFNLETGGEVTYAGLEEGTRVSGSFIDGSKKRPDKCLVSHCYVAGVIGVWDYENLVWHLPVWEKPLGKDEHAQLLAEQLRRLERLRPPPGKAAPQPPQGTDFAERVDWLLQTHAFYVGADKVVELYEPNDRCLVGKDAFRTQFAAWREETIGPRGGKQAVLATGAWEINDNRPSVRGVRLRPDQDFPLYEEGGAVFKNIYRRPQHYGEGDLAPFTAFLERFIPDAREREWLLDWMAHKQRRPEIPGTSIWFVADGAEDVLRVGKYGTGRGIMFSIAALLYGPDYCTAQDFDVISGASGQSAYNDWLHYSILATVDEAATSPTAHRRGERKSTYEVLKNVIDPAPKPRTFRPKYGKIFTGMSYCSLWVATNHANAAAIPATDRRITVLRNGREMTPEEALELVAWREAPGSIAALAAALEARDLTGFSMFHPLDTAGKREMAELSASPVEEILVDLAGEAGRGLVFTRPYLEQEVEAIIAGGGMRGSGNAWRGQLEGAWATHCVALKTSAGSPTRARVGGKQYRLFSFRENLRAARKLTEAQRRHHVAKWGPVDGVDSPFTVIQGGLEPAPGG